jgi:hypothetical protein
MKRIFIVLVSGLMLVTLCGCIATLMAEKTASVAAPPETNSFSFDLSTPGADAGKLTVQCRQPSYQISVERYAIRIDSNAPLVISKQSDTDVKLDAGKHSLELYAASSDPAESEKVSYGKPTMTDIVIIKDQDRKLKYTGPYRLLGEGKLEVIQ